MVCTMERRTPQDAAQSLSRCVPCVCGCVRFCSVSVSKGACESDSGGANPACAPSQRLRACAQSCALCERTAMRPFQALSVETLPGSTCCTAGARGVRACRSPLHLLGFVRRWAAAGSRSARCKYIRAAVPGTFAGPCSPRGTCLLKETSMPAEASSAQLVPVALRSWTDQNDFSIKELLTKGSYGKVYLASHTNTGRDLIVKVRD